jgi:methyl-accepting chemotaxis protein
MFGAPSLQQKLNLIVAGAISAAALLIGAAAALIGADRHTEERMNYVRATGAVFSAAISEAVATQDKQGAAKALRGVGRADRITFGVVYLPDGAALIEIGSGVFLESDLARLSDQGEGVSIFAALSRTTVAVKTLIVNGGREVGLLVLVADNSDLSGVVRDTFLYSCLGAFVALAISLALARSLISAALQPLKQLTAAVQRMTDAQAAFETVPIATHDEVGALCAGFNEMIAAIGARDKSITDLATHDLETNLPNRLAFQGNLARLLETTRERVVCVACFGVERFD